MKQYNTMEDLLNEYNKPETQARLNELRDQELGVLKTEPVQENLLRFYAKTEEVLKIAQGRFYYKGELVEDKYQVYERFNEWLKMAEEGKDTKMVEQMGPNEITIFIQKTTNDKASKHITRDRRRNKSSSIYQDLREAR